MKRLVSFACETLSAALTRDHPCDNFFTIEGVHLIANFEYFTVCLVSRKMEKEAQIRSWLLEESDEEQTNCTLEDSDCDYSDADAANSDHDSESEVSCDEIDTNEPGNGGGGPHYLGKDNVTVWNVHPPPRNRRRSKKNIVIHPPGVKATARHAETVLRSWEVFFPDEVLAEIVNFTNDRLRIMRDNYSRERDVRDTNLNEIKALIGLLYLAGVTKSSHQNIQDLWATDMSAPEYFRIVMRYNRFYLLLRALRFDDIRTREERKVLDKLAPVREIFEGFVHRCEESYSVGEYVTLDEMLESFRGRCSFRQYMPKKPSKYGIKVFALVDSRMFYTSKMEIYAGRQPEGSFSLDNSPSSVVRRMVHPIQNSGRNVTVDNWFSSVTLVNELVREKNLTMVATVRKNKRELPVEIVNTKDRTISSSLFAFGEHSMLVSYVPKKNRNVILISSMHDSDTIDQESGDRMKPEVITFYNMTKGGVDVDELKSLYSVSRVCCRWPLRIFFMMLDIAAINSQIIFRCNISVNMTRRKYLKTLAFDLTKPHLKERYLSPGIHSDPKLKIMKVLEIKPEIPEVTQEARQKCSYCPRKKNRKTTTRCAKCTASICGEHTVTICQQCHQHVENSESSE